jgi:PhnB protein
MAVVPMLAYADGVAAMDWLQEAFGFEEAARWLAEDGTLAHGELRAGDGLVMLATPTADYEGPRAHAAHCDAAARWLEVPFVVDGVLVEVDDVDAHCEKARAAGAAILSGPEDVPGVGIRHYRAEDCEGHRWMFSQPLGDGS